MQNQILSVNFFWFGIFFSVNFLSFLVLSRALPLMRLVSWKKVFWLVALLMLSSFLFARLAGFYMYGFAVWWVKGILYLSVSWHIMQMVIVILSPIYFWVAYQRKKILQMSEDMIKKQHLLERRRFLGLATYGLTLGALGITVNGVSEAGTVVVNRSTVPLINLPSSLNGFKIAQISDVHLGPFVSLLDFEKICNTIKKENPDMVVVTGDLVDDINLLFPALDMLETLQEETSYDVYFCLGNHEYYANISKVEKLLKRSSICVLRNSAVLVKDSNVPFYLVGVDYPFAKGTEKKAEERKMFLQEALKEVPEGAFKILMAHHPDFIEDAFLKNIPFTLTGHTHGGQVGIGERSLFGILGLGYKYMRGWYAHNKCIAYVHSGTGHWLPFRLGCPPEIVIFTLKPA